MTDESPYILIIDWQGKDLSSCVGPFATDREAIEWRDLNVVGGATATLQQLAHPYRRFASEGGA
jgi:hypothetical protein